MVTWPIREGKPIREGERLVGLRRVERLVGLRRVKAPGVVSDLQWARTLGISAVRAHTLSFSYKVVIYLTAGYHEHH
jgi:hypothetical protein